MKIGLNAICIIILMVIYKNRFLKNTFFVITQLIIPAILSILSSAARHLYIIKWLVCS